VGAQDYFYFFYKKMALIRKKYINQNKLIIIKNENFSFIFLSKQTFEILNVLTNMKVNQKEKIKND
jgi:hypothetical protein